MEIDIGEVNSTVHAVDSNALLDPRTLQRIVTAVLAAVREHENHERRVRAEQTISAGVAHEMERDRS